MIRGRRRRAFVFRAKRHGLLLHALGFLPEQDLLADKFVRTIQSDKKAEARFQRRPPLGKIVAVERQAGFEPERVARAEAAWFQAERFAGFEEGKEEVFGNFVREKDFDAVLARVAGASGENLLTVPRVSRDFIPLRLGPARAQKSAHDFAGFGTLQGESAVKRASICKKDSGT